MSDKPAYSNTYGPNRVTEKSFLRGVPYPNGGIRLLNGGLRMKGTLSARLDTVSEPGAFRPPTPLSGSRSVVNYGPGINCRKFNPVNGAEQTSDYGFVFDIPLEELNSLHAYDANRAARELQKLRNKAVQKYSSPDVMLSVALAERKKTVSMIAGNARDIAQSVNNFRQSVPGKVKSIREAVRRFPGKWLEHQYGWTPTLLDMQGACKYLAEIDTADRVKPPYVTVKVKREYTEPTSKRTMSNISAGRLTAIPLYWERFLDRKTTCKIRYDAEVVFPALLPITELGFDNPLLYMWERLPYSFVVDQFLTVGDWLTGMNLLDPYRFLAACETIHTETKFRINLSAPDRYSAPYMSTAVPSYWQQTGHGHAFWRSVGAARPIARLMMKDDPWNLTMLANDLSLLVTALDVKSPRSRDVLSRLRG